MRYPTQTCPTYGFNSSLTRCKQIFLIFILINNFIHSQEFNNVSLPVFVGTSLSVEFGILATEGDRFFMSASSSQSTGNNTGGVLLEVTNSGLQDAFFLTDENGKELFIFNFSRFEDGSFLVFYGTDDEPFPTVVVNGRIYCARFTMDFELLWNFQIDTGINSVTPRFLKCQLSSSGIIVFSFFGGDGYYVGGIQEDGTTTWTKKLGFFPTQTGTTQYCQDLYGDLLLFSFYQSISRQNFICKIDIKTGDLISSISIGDRLAGGITFTLSGWSITGFQNNGLYIANFGSNDELIQSKFLFSKQIVGATSIDYLQSRNEFILIHSGQNQTGITRLSDDLDLIESSLFSEFRTAEYSIPSNMDDQLIFLIGNRADASVNEFIYTMTPIDLVNRGCKGGELCYSITSDELNTSLQPVSSSPFSLVSTNILPIWRVISLNPHFKSL